MDERIKKALGNLDNVTLISTPLSISLNDGQGHQDNNNNNNNKKNKYEIINEKDDKSKGNINNSQLVETLPFRPWCSTDYYKRVKTYTIAWWFAKPALVDPLQCSRYGWINCDIDMLECTLCSKRLYYNIPLSLSLQQKTKRIEEFAGKVRSNGHRESCAWRDNGGPSFYARLINVPSQTQLESFIKRANNIYNNLSMFPDLDVYFWPLVQKKDPENNLLQMIIVIADLPLRDSKARVACVMALCGWDYGNGIDHFDDDNHEKDKDKDQLNNNNNNVKKESLHCQYCQRVCGMWNFTTLNDDPFKSIYPQLSTNLNNNNSSNNNKILNSTTSKPSNNNNSIIKRDRQIFEDKLQLSMESLIDKILTVPQPFSSSFSSISNNDNNNNNNNETYKAFGDTSKRTRYSTGWDWGTSFTHHASQSLSQSIEINQQKPKPFSPIIQHRWFCPWIVYSNEEIIDNDEKSSSSSLNENQQQQQPCGWESLLQLLTNQPPQCERKKLEDLDVRATLRLWGS